VKNGVTDTTHGLTAAAMVCHSHAAVLGIQTLSMFKQTDKPSQMQSDAAFCTTFAETVHYMP
jgi:hypothetical protein